MVRICLRAVSVRHKMHQMDALEERPNGPDGTQHTLRAERCSLIITLRRTYVYTMLQT